MTWTIPGQTGGFGEQQVRDIVEQVIQNRGLTTNLVPNSVPIGATLTNLITPGVTGQPINAVKTGLPPNPQDGEDVYYLATNSVWHFRYQKGSSSQYKWDFVGGVPLISEIQTDESTGSTTYTDLATVGPSVTVPLAGDYLISFGAELYNFSTTKMSLSIAGSTPSDNDQIEQPSTGGSSARTIGKSGIAAQSVIKAQYRVSGVGTGHALGRWLNVYPVRVG